LWRSGKLRAYTIVWGLGIPGYGTLVDRGTTPECWSANPIGEVQVCCRVQPRQDPSTYRLSPASRAGGSQVARREQEPLGDSMCHWPPCLGSTVARRNRTTPGAVGDSAEGMTSLWIREGMPSSPGLGTPRGSVARKNWNTGKHLFSATGPPPTRACPMCGQQGGGGGCGAAVKLPLPTFQSFPPTGLLTRAAMWHGRP
jgi:hypothetical protein